MKENNKKIQEFFHKGAHTRIAIFTNVMYHKEWIGSVLLGKEVAFWSDEDSTNTNTNTKTDDTYYQVICQNSTNKSDEINYFIGLFPLFSCRLAGKLYPSILLWFFLSSSFKNVYPLASYVSEWHNFFDQ